MEGTEKKKKNVRNQTSDKIDYIEDEKKRKVNVRYIKRWGKSDNSEISNSSKEPRTKECVSRWRVENEPLNSGKCKSQ